MWDVMNANQLSKLQAEKDSTISIKNLQNSYTKKIFSIHQITKEDFEKSYHYFESNPSEMKILLDSISNYGLRKRELVMNK